ncbi:MAG: MATE family efflux transporter [Lachnospiraceae bacterium]|nr:MATE family efflux transporter [Lachnospiraceae bacterium]
MNNPFLEESVGKLYARFLPSAIIALLISSVASLIDTIVVSYFMGPTALSAVNICMPIYSILTAVGLLIVGGAGTLYSQYLGRNEKEKAQKVFTLAAFVLLVIGVIYMVVGILFTDDIVRMLGANDAVFDMASQYARVLFYFVLFNILFPFLQTFLRIDLNPNLTVLAIVICALVNLVLDILFVGPFLSPTGFGTTGAAYATSLAYVVAFVLMLTHFLSKKNTLRLAKHFFSGKELKDMIVTGLPASVTLFGTAITMTVFNNFIMINGEYYGVGVGELYVSVYSVVVQVVTISMAVYVGIAQCAQPIMAANFGAGRKDRIKALFVQGLKIEIVANIILGVVLFFGAEKIAAMFSMDKGAYDMTEVAILAIRVFVISLIFTGINQMVQYLLQVTDYVLQSTMVSLLSGTILMIVGIYLLAGVIMPGNPDGLGVWLTYTFAQGLTLIYAIIVYNKKKKEIFG